MTRSRLPNRRGGQTVRFSHEGVRYFATVGRDARGQIAELFLDAGKPGSAANTIARDAAVVLSIALQHGVPLSEIMDALTKLDDGSPAGPLGIALALAVGNPSGSPP